MLTFDADKEPTTVKIQIKEYRFACINDRPLSGDYTTQKIGKNKYRKYWKGDTMWVTEQIAHEIEDLDLAKIVDTRSTNMAINNEEKSEIKKHTTQPGRPKGSKSSKRRKKHKKTKVK